jgi:uncharacterized protein YjiS (DUF1127 family)
MFTDEDVLKLPYRYCDDPGFRGVEGVRRARRGLSAGHYEAVARGTRGEHFRKLVNGGARKVLGLAWEPVLKAFAEIKRRRAIASTVKALFVLDDSTLRDIGVDRSEIWSVAIAAVDETADAERLNRSPKTADSERNETAAVEDSISMAA